MEVGLKLGGWRCDRILGRGNFGVVGLWVNDNTQESRALKKFEVGRDLGEPVSSEVKKRWEREVDLLYHQIESPYIVSALPLPMVLGSLSRLPLLCMEYCSGGDLRQVLRNVESMAGLAEAEVRKVLKCVVGAIEYLHSIKVVHRDLKPENILRSGIGKDSVYKLSDLGFAKTVSTSDTLCSTVLGTVQYLAPEVFTGEKYDISVDYWSLGVIGFEIACGMRPFLHGRSPPEWIPLAEKKERGIIGIYESKEGTPVSTSRIPYPTHLSERLKQCLEMWLGMMLEFDPKKRGRKIHGCDGSSSEVVCFQVLKTILEVQMLDVYCPGQRLNFAIGRSTKISQVQEWIARDIGISPDEQIIISSDGCIFRTGSEFHPICIYQDKIDLFMIPKRLTKMKIKAPSAVNRALNNENFEFSDRIFQQKVFSSLLHFLQTEIKELEMMEKALDAFSKCLSYEERGIDSTESALQHRLVELGGYLAFETEIQSAEFEIEEIQLNTLVKTSGDLETLKTQSFDLSKEISNYKTDFSQHKIEILPPWIPELKKTYKSILESLESWKTGENVNGTNHSIEKKVARFLSVEDPICNSLQQKFRTKIQMLSILDNIQARQHDLETKLDKWKTDLVNSRCEKQRAFLCHMSSSAYALDTRMEGLDSIMQESIHIGNETEHRLNNALKGAAQILETSEKLQWSFLDADGGDQ